MRSTSNRQALQWMDSDSQGASVLLTAQRLIAIEQSLCLTLPKSLNRGFAVSELSGKMLTLTVYNTAFAAKLRQFQARLVTHLQTEGWPIDEIRLRVSVQPRAQHVTPMQKQARNLDETDLGHFETLAGALRPGPLADSVQKLLARHRRGATKS
jgi:hypothetical protein